MATSNLKISKTIDLCKKLNIIYKMSTVLAKNIL